jgi:DNA-binding GntR family transcriptional regulator
MPSGKTGKRAPIQALAPLTETLQLGTRVYQALVDSIVNGQIGSGTQLRPDAIARQLDVSTTPVREAMHRLENDGLTIKLPYQGWFVREFTEEQIRKLYEFRAALERLSVRLACQHITDEEIRWLREHQATGEAALDLNDMEAYRLYNRDFHAAFLRSANNPYLSSAMSQVALQSEMLTGKTIRIVGRPLRAIEEHSQLIDLIEARHADKAEILMGSHIMSALEDIISSHSASKPEPATQERVGLFVPSNST